MEFATDILEENDGCQRYTVCEFTFRSGPLQNNITFFEPMIPGRKKWIAMIDAIRRRSVADLVFSDRNGEGRIRTDGTNLTFTASRFGHGGGTIIDIVVPVSDQYADEFETIVAHPSFDK